MAEILKQVAKLCLPLLLNWLIKKAEYKFSEAKKGNDKKAYVFNEVADFFMANEINLNPEKLSAAIESKVFELINSKK